MNRNGQREPILADALPYFSPRVSPDGSRVAVEIAGRDGVDIHIYDLIRRTLTRLTPGSAHGRNPLWTPDGRRVVFYSDSDGGGLYSMAADGTGPLKRHTTTRAFQVPYSWADAGRTLLIEQRATDSTGAAGIYVLSLAGEPIAKPLLQSVARGVEPAVSPDGRWLAYTSRDAAASDVFVQPFPDVDAGRWRISTDGGDSPLWSRDGKELYFVSRARAMSIPIETAPTFRPGTPAAMFDLPPFYQSAMRIRRQWDIGPDERFLIMNPGELTAGEHSQARIVVVLNWYEELKRLVPTK
jgi:Tol biopolymer transport system component